MGAESAASVDEFSFCDFAMISAIVFVSDAKRHGAARDHELLVRSLAWLVSAVVAGVIYDVTLAGPPDLRLADIADQAGCKIAEGAREAQWLAAAIAAAKYPRLLILESGYQPADGMIGELESLGRSVAPDVSVQLQTVPASIWEQLWPARAATIGLFAPTSLCRALPNRRFQGLRAGLKPKARFITRAIPIV